MFESFWLRQLFASLKLLSGYEQLPERAEEWPDYFDNTDGIGPVKRTLFYKDKRSGIYLPYKGLSKPLDVDVKVGIEAHITAIAFGTTKGQRKFWLQLIDSGDIPEEIWSKFGADPEKAAHRMALHKRFWGVPYHWVALLNGDILHNNDITRYTYHGNGGNRLLIGVSLEGSYPGLEKNRRSKHNEYDNHTIETAQGALRLAIKNSRDLGAPVQWLYCHRQYSGGRVGDPGEGWWKEIGLPVAEEMNLEVNYPFKNGSGKPIPKEWDENGLVDYRGRPIKAA